MPLPKAEAKRRHRAYHVTTSDAEAARVLRMSLSGFTGWRERAGLPRKSAVLFGNPNIVKIRRAKDDRTVPLTRGSRIIFADDTPMPGKKGKVENVHRHYCVIKLQDGRLVDAHPDCLRLLEVKV